MDISNNKGFRTNIRISLLYIYLFAIIKGYVLSNHLKKGKLSYIQNT